MPMENAGRPVKQGSIEHPQLNLLLIYSSYLFYFVTLCPIKLEWDLREIFCQPTYFCCAVFALRSA